LPPTTVAIKIKSHQNKKIKEENKSHRELYEIKIRGV
jgi:hypothetical protein